MATYNHRPTWKKLDQNVQKMNLFLRFSGHLNLFLLILVVINRKTVYMGNHFCPMVLDMRNKLARKLGFNSRRLGPAILV